ncbi:MAG TPA: META domain-containing protein [Sphingobacteriaceae bacterium]
MKYFSFIAAVLCLYSCKVLDGTADRQVLGENTQWVLTAIAEKPVSIENAYLRFDTKEHRISGKAACNGFSAEYEIFTENRITFSEISSTKMYCEGLMDEESEILTNLRSVKRYEIKADRLYFYSDGGLLLTFKR